MESKILIDSHYNGDGQLIITYKANEEDLRDKMIGRFLWRYAKDKRCFAVVDIYDDRPDGSCLASVCTLSTEELNGYLPEILKLVESLKEEPKQTPA